MLKYGGRLPRPSPWRRMDFPFVETINVNVELAQVELRLPHAYRWGQFEGTLRRMEEVGDFEAGILNRGAGPGASAAGLASLDLPLPAPDPARWAVFRFTTPRGEQALHARAVSREWMAGLWRLGALAAAVLLVWLAAAAIGASARARRVWSSVLLFAGALALFLGILPFAGLAALAGGAVMRRDRRP